MDESAPQSIFGGPSCLAFRPKGKEPETAPAVQTDVDMQAIKDNNPDDGSIPWAAQRVDGEKPDSELAPWAVVTRRTNGHQVQQLMPPPSHYASPPIALFATGGGGSSSSSSNAAAAGGGAVDPSILDTIDDDVLFCEQVMALHKIAGRAAAQPRHIERLRRIAHYGNSRIDDDWGLIGSGDPLRDAWAARRQREAARRKSGQRRGPARLVSVLPKRQDAAGVGSMSSTSAAATFSPMARTLGGRVAKAETERFRRPVLMRHHHQPPATTAAAAASASSSSQPPSRHIGASSAVHTVHPRLVLATILALPGFDFGFDFDEAAPQQNPGAASNDAALTLNAKQLAQVLGHPAVRQRCGRSPHRRGVARLLVLVLTFPLAAHHGKAAFEAACGGFTPGDENRPAFWAQYAKAFAAWLGIDKNDKNDKNADDKDPFVEGVVLHTLVTRLGHARQRYLEAKAQRKRGGSGSGSGSGSTPNKDMDMDEPMVLDKVLDNADADLDATVGTVNDNTNLPGLVATLRRAHRTRKRLPVSKAVDAWLLFVQRRHQEDLDPDLLAELSLD